MKNTFAALALCLAALPAFAQKACEELKSEISAKIEAKGIKNFQLDIIPADQVKDEKQVGTCESGKKKIVYKKK